MTVTADTGGLLRPLQSLLRAFLADEVLPHARAQKRTRYRAARHDPPDWRPPLRPRRNRSGSVHRRRLPGR